MVQELSALAESLRLAAVGQKTNMAMALKPMGQDMQEQAADELVGW